MMKKINNLKDVERFAKALITEGTIFHPDDDFSEYVKTESKEIAFTKKQAALRNSLMERCFIVCSEEGVDIYNFMNEISLKETGMEHIIPLPSKV